MFSIVQNSYSFGLYTKADVKLMVQVSFITADEYTTITGEAYAI